MQWVAFVRLDFPMADGGGGRGVERGGAGDSFKTIPFMKTNTCFF